MSLLLASAHVVTMDDAGTEHARRLGARRGRARRGGRRRRAARGRRARRPRRRGRHARPRQHAPPPLPDAHARAGAGGRPLHVAARRSTRSGRGIDAEAEYAAARTGLAELALSGCTTVFDHHYVFPRGDERARSRPRCARRASSACGSSPRAARWTSASRDGGLPPDELVEELDAVLADTERLAELARRRRAACRSPSRRARRSRSRGG